MERPRSSSRRLAGLAAALALSLAGAAAAQPAGHPPHGAGPDMLVAGILAVKANLNLDTSQQLAWDNAVAATKAARQAARDGRARVQAALQAELAKPEPDLAAIASLTDQVQAQNQVQRVAARTQWLGLYANLSPTQKGVVRDALAQRLARMEAFRARLRERFPPPGNG